MRLFQGQMRSKKGQMRSIEFTTGQVKQRFGVLSPISEKSLTSVESTLVGVITIVSLPYTFTSCSLTTL